MLSIRNGTTRTVPVTGLDKNTEYEFQVLAFTSVGDGPNSSVEVERTKEDGKSSTMTVTYPYTSNPHIHPLFGLCIFSVTCWFDHLAGSL